MSVYKGAIIAQRSIYTNTFLNQSIHDAEFGAMSLGDEELLQLDSSAEETERYIESVLQGNSQEALRLQKKAKGDDLLI